MRRCTSSQRVLVVFRISDSGHEPGNDAATPIPDAVFLCATLIVLPGSRPPGARTQEPRRGRRRTRPRRSAPLTEATEADASEGQTDKCEGGWFRDDRAGFP